MHSFTDSVYNQTTISNSENIFAFNDEEFQKRDGSRSSVFEEEKEYLNPLPGLPYEIAEWVYGRSVNFDCHVVYDKNRYSCPYQYVGQKADLKITDSAVEIFINGERAATHIKFPDYVNNKYSTHAGDMPDRLQKPEWDDERIKRWAYSIGIHVGNVIDRIFSSVKIKEQGYNPSLSVLRLGKSYTDARLEKACELALTRIRIPRYHHLKAILASNQDILIWSKRNCHKRELLRLPADMCGARNITGARAMINEETKRKLCEMNLGDAVVALELQRHDNNYTALPFDERFQHLVDYLYQENYNKTAQRLIKTAQFRLPKAEMRGIHYSGRKLNKDALMELSTCQFIDSNKNVIIQGFTGSGKTYLACALGKQACKKKIRSKYVRLPDLLVEYSEAALVPKAKAKLLKRYNSHGLLIVDEWLLEDISEEEQHFLYELFERRHDLAPSIFCTQYRKEDWHNRLGGGVYADAIMDRIVHGAVWIETGSMNMREYCAKHGIGAT